MTTPLQRRHPKRVHRPLKRRSRLALEQQLSLVHALDQIASMASTQRRLVTEVRALQIQGMRGQPAVTYSQN